MKINQLQKLKNSLSTALENVNKQIEQKEIEEYQENLLSFLKAYKDSNWSLFYTNEVDGVKPSLVWTSPQFSLSDSKLLDVPEGNIGCYLKNDWPSEPYFTAPTGKDELLIELIMKAKLEKVETKFAVQELEKMRNDAKASLNSFESMLELVNNISKSKI